MGRPKKAIPSHAEIEPEELSQDVPEDEPEAEEDDPAGPESASSGRSLNQADMVRKAVAAGHEKPSSGVPYIKTHFGVDIDPKYYSVAKSHLKKREAKSSSAPEPTKRGPKPKVNPPTAAPPAPSSKAASNGEPDLIESLETLKPLIAAMGAEKVKRLVDLLG